MKLKSTFKSAVGVVTLLTLNSTVNAEDFFVDSKASYYDAVSQVGPGDDIVFKNKTQTKHSAREICIPHSHSLVLWRLSHVTRRVYLDAVSSDHVQLLI